ncbi:MAG: beta-methylgalactoside transporter [Firmicutes bacterium]|nr:beta-methylgalactoside transporter [Bacillota bacterium]
MSREELKQQLDKSRKGATLPVVGGIVNWWYDLRVRWSAFSASNGKQKAKSVREFLLNKGLMILMVIFSIVALFVVPGFSRWSSIVNIISYTAQYMFLALGVAGIILLTGTDLSASRTVALCAAVVGAMMVVTKTTLFKGMGTVPWILPLVISICIGAAIGAANGFFTAKFKLHSFIVTLSMQFMLISVIKLFFGLGGNGQASFTGFDPKFKNLIQGGFELGGVTIPWMVVYAIIAVMVMWLIWNKTKFGKNMYAVGCNPEAATVAGVSVFKVTLMVFVMAGVMYGISGFVQAGVEGIVNVNFAPNQELYAIAACVIGGVSFNGGVGKISGVVLGVFIFQVLSLALQNWPGLNPNLVEIITGAILLAAVVLDIRKYAVRR